MQITIGYLYPHSMSTYGDRGNVLCLQERAQWRGIEVKIVEMEIGQEIKEPIDIYFFGGGQDSAQSSLQKDLQEVRGTRLKDDIEKGIPLLAICGGYQLLGQAYTPWGKEKIVGLGIFPVETFAAKVRMIGDLVVEANSKLHLDPAHPFLVGFENHSGKTERLETKNSFPLGKVRHGFGNNGSDRTEGCVYRNAIGCYLHGSLLPKNPHLADWLLEKTLKRHSSTTTLSTLDDRLEWQAHDCIARRYLGK